MLGPFLSLHSTQGTMADKNEQSKKIEQWKDYVFEQEGLDDLDLAEDYIETLMESFVDQLRERYNKLVRSDRYSMYTSVRHAARLGVLLSGRYNEAYLVAFGNKVNLILDYKGLIKVAKKSPEVVDVNSAVIYSNDDYQIDEMNPQDSYHRREFVQRGDRIGAWAKIFKVDGPGFIRALDQDAIEKAKESSDNQKLWEEHTNEFWRKTAIRNAMKMVDLPHQTARVLEAIEADEPDYEELPEGDEDGSEHAQTVQGNEGVKDKLDSDGTDEEPDDEPDEKPDDGEPNKQRRIDMARKIAIDVLEISNEVFEKIKEDVDAAKHLLNKMQKAKEDEDYFQELKDDYIEGSSEEESDEPDVPEGWEADIGEYHTGNGWHLFPDGERVRGTDKAEQYRMANKPGSDVETEQDEAEEPEPDSSSEESTDEDKSDVEEMEERFEEPDEDESSDDDEELGELECSECGGEVANESVKEMAVKQYGDQLCAGCAMEAKKE